MRFLLGLTVLSVGLLGCSHTDNDGSTPVYFPGGTISEANPPLQPPPTPSESIDLTVDPQLLADTVTFEDVFFDGSSCAVQEGCVGDVGLRTLMRFSVATINYGESHLELGAPEDNLDLFEYSPCHGHYHLTGFADYMVQNAGGTVATGHKQAFCLMDIYPYDNKPAQWFDCDYQGISSGWADIYDSSLDCQWVDVTDLAPGDYDLQVTVDTIDMFAEVDETNNVVTIPVTIP